MKLLRIYLFVLFCIVAPIPTFADDCDAGIEAFSDCSDPDSPIPLDDGVWFLIIAAGIYGVRTSAGSLISQVPQIGRMLRFKS